MAKEKKPQKAISTPWRRRGALTPAEEMARMFEQFFGASWPHRFRWGGRDWPELGAPFEGTVPSVDVIEHEEEVLVRAELPGVDKDNLEVTLADDALTIKAGTAKEKEEDEGQYHRREIVRGTFLRTIRLPVDVDGEHTKSTFKNGVLEVRAPKLTNSKRRVITVD